MIRHNSRLFMNCLFALVLMNPWGSLQADDVRLFGQNDPLVRTAKPWLGGFSLSSSLKVFESDKVMGQIAYGDGIERFRGFPSYTLDAGGSLVAVPALVCYVGYEHAWTQNMKSVIAYSRATVDNPAVAPTSLKSTDYFAANILWTPIERMRLGLEYLYGDRVDQNASRGDANRLQFAIWHYLP